MLCSPEKKIPPKYDFIKLVFFQENALLENNKVSSLCP